MIQSLANSPSIIIAGHRGYKFAYPENTLLAFQKALELGVDMLEFDLRLSKDNVVMVMHDETLERTTNGSGRLSDYSLAVALLQEYGYLSRCVFTCFDGDIIAYLYDKYQVKTQGFPGEAMSNFAPGDNGTYSKMWAAGISMSLLTPELAASFQNSGILAWCYCPDDDEQVAYALECGVTLMTCNDPRPALRMRPIIA
jgi:glycerophosphoryl diester phosphodiesterase